MRVRSKAPARAASAKSHVQSVPKALWIGGTAFLAAVGLLLLLRPDFSLNLRAMDKAAASVVTLNTFDSIDVPVGSACGFAAIEEGLIVTSFHVLDGETYRVEVVTADGDVLQADSVLCHDAEKDIAVLHVPACTLPPLNTTSGNALEPGDRLTAIGSSRSTGVIGSLMPDTPFTQWLFATPISGSCGAPVLDERGRVVGVAAALREEDAALSTVVPFRYITELYRSRSPADAQSPAKLWLQREHIYSVDYVMAHAPKLAGQLITVRGYLSAIDRDLYAVSDPSQVLGYDLREASSPDDLFSDRALEIREQHRNGRSLRIQYFSGKITPAGSTVGMTFSARGRITVFTENNSGPDIRFITHRFYPE